MELVGQWARGQVVILNRKYLSLVLTVIPSLVGICVSGNIVVGMLEGSPAALDGRLNVGDEITMVDGVIPTHACCIKMIRGPPGTTVNITIRRNSNGESVVVVLQRKISGLHTIQGGIGSGRTNFEQLFLTQSTPPLLKLDWG